MAFNTSISGLRAAQQDMGVISNNIANVGTAGFKRSDALFAELYSASLGGAFDQPGAGVTLEAIRNDFGQGNFEFTSSQLDLAIDGNGMFVLQNGPNTEYTRAGAFRLDGDGFVVTESGANVQGYPADDSGRIIEAGLTNLQITPALLSQKPTANVAFSGNLDSRAAAPVDGTGAALTFDATDPATYNFLSNVTVYDSAGAPHDVTMYFVQDVADGNSYDVHITVDDSDQAITYALDFSTTGALANAADATSYDLTIDTALTPGADALAITIDFSGVTGYGATSANSGITQDGYAAGQLSAFQFDREGIAYASYTNGETRAVGQVALATFTNPGGLTPTGKTNFAQSDNSGVALVGTPSGEGKGYIRPSALESANVDLTVELLALIEAQRNFQSNAQAVQNANDASQAILQLR
jgi:flagellar hook protein FlgE